MAKNKVKRPVLFGLTALCAVLIAGTALLAVWLTGASARLDRALDPSKYERAQVKFTQTVKPPADEAQSSGEEEPPEPEPYDTATMTKDGGRIYEESGGRYRYYFYSRDGVDYALYQDTLSGILEEGKWTEAPAEYFRKPLFSFEALREVRASDFESRDGAYEPKGDRLADVFFGLLQIQNAAKYSGYRLRLEIKNGRLKSITAAYMYDYAYEVVQEYAFDYPGTAVSVPAAEQAYDPREGAPSPSSQKGG